MTHLPTTRRYGKIFDEVAAEYDRNRPTYPDELVEHACQIAGIVNGDRVFEIGCGSGQLTRSLVARGLHVTALDPGKHLIALAKQNLKDLGEVEFVNARFEDIRLPKQRFQAVFSGSAFHWVDPKVSWKKTADMLLPGGKLALIQYRGLQDKQSAGDQELIQSAMTKVAPDIAVTLPKYKDLASIVRAVERRRKNISEVWAWIGNYDLARDYASQLFDDVQVAAVPILIKQTAKDLNALIGTTSIYTRMSPKQRQDFENESLAIYKQLGRPIRSSLVAVLVTARHSKAV